MREWRDSFNVGRGAFEKFEALRAGVTVIDY
jgi:hypothetical protein